MQQTVSSAKDGRKTGDGSGVGFFIPLPPDLGAQFPDLGDEDRSNPHTTFLYVGEVPEEREAEFLEVSARVLGTLGGLVRGYLDHLDYFTQPDKDRKVAVMAIRFDKDLAALRWNLRDALLDAGFQVADGFPLLYKPHATIQYMEGLGSEWKGHVPSGSWSFDRMEVWGLPKLHSVYFGESVEGRVASRFLESMEHGVSVALMKFLSDVAKKAGVSKNTYVVGGAVRNFILGVPVKDVDVVIDSIASGKDSAWFAKKVKEAIPVPTSFVTNQYGVALLTVKGDWFVDGANLNGETIEIANARKESYGGEAGQGYKPHMVAPATIKEDVIRRDFTFNTLMWRLHDLSSGPDAAEILDITECGLKDLQAGEMRCPSDPDKTFSNDPSRLIRAIKFILKYGFKVPPEVEASIRRNGLKLRNVPPGHLSNMIIELFYEGGWGRRALEEMDKLGLLEVIKDIARTDKPFREALSNWADRKADISFLFDLIDIGMPTGRRLNFLTQPQKDRLREITVQWPAEKSDEFVNLLEQPGRIKGLAFGGLIQELGLQGPGIKALTDTVRQRLLDDPDLVRNPDKLRRLVGLGKTAGIDKPLDKDWLMAVRRGWLKLMNPAIRDYGDVLKAFNALDAFAENLQDQVLNVRRDLFTNDVRTDKVIAGIKRLREAISDSRYHAKFWSEWLDGTSVGFRLGEDRTADALKMLELYRTNFSDASGTSVKGRKSPSNPWANSRQVPLTYILDAVLKGLYEIAKKNLEVGESGDIPEYESFFREFSLGGMKILISDPKTHGKAIGAYVRQIGKAKHLLEAAGFAKDWRGLMMVQSSDWHVLTDTEREIYRRRGYDIQETAGQYRSGSDSIVLTSPPDWSLVLTIVHEIGHRHWSKYLDVSDRKRFADWIAEGLAPVSDYGKTNPSEAFAEVFAHYVNRKNMTRDQLESFKAVVNKTASEKKVLKNKKGCLILARVGGLSPVRQRNEAAPARKGLWAFLWPWFDTWLLSGTNARGWLENQDQKGGTRLEDFKREGYRKFKHCGYVWTHFDIPGKEVLTKGHWNLVHSSDLAREIPRIYKSELKALRKQYWEDSKTPTTPAGVEEQKQQSLEFAEYWIRRQDWSEMCEVFVEPHMADKTAAFTESDLETATKEFEEVVQRLTDKRALFEKAFANENVDDPRYLRHRKIGLKAWMEKPWAWLVFNGNKLSRIVLERKSVPSGQGKALEMAARTFMSAKRFPADFEGWMAKNSKYVAFLLNAAKTWEDKKEGGSELFKIGPFTVHNTIGAADADLEGVRKMFEAATSAVGRLGGDYSDFKKVLYGDVLVVARLSQPKVMAWYTPNEDAVYVRQMKTAGIDDVHNLIHELAHRFWRKFADAKLKARWVQRDDIVRWGDDWFKGLKLPGIGDTLPIILNKQKYPKIVDLDAKVYKLAVPTILDPYNTVSIPRTKVLEWVREDAKKEQFPTPYAARGGVEEHFCEALALKALGKLQKNHEEALDRVFSGEPDPKEIAFVKDVQEALRKQNPSVVAFRHLKKAGFFNVGDKIWFGKYKNKAGIIKGFSRDPKGNPTVIISPVPQGRKQDKEFGLYKIWHADPAKKVAVRWIFGSPVREPWQMTFDEFRREVKTQRIEWKAVQTFEDFLKTKKVDPKELPSLEEEADVLGGLLFSRPNMTQHEKGRLKGIVHKKMLKDKLVKEWKDTVDKVETHTDLDLSRSSDAAYLKVQHKRAIRKALSEGNPVPSEVLAEYPDIKTGMRVAQDDRWDRRKPEAFRTLIPEGISKRIYQEQIGEVGGFKVWLVDGIVIRDKIDIDFTAGGNPSRYGYIPADEIWLEKTGDSPFRNFDLAATLIHELVESWVMSNLGWDYDRAHDTASKFEKGFRKHPRLVPENRILLIAEFLYRKWLGSSMSGRVAARYKDKKTVKDKNGDDMVVYEYSDRQIANRNREKAERVEKLRGKLDKLVSQVKKDLKSDDEKTRMTALAVGLINDVYERVGNPGSAKDGHFGVTGWLVKHVSFSDGKALLKYVGKSGVEQDKETSDAGLVKALKDAVKGKKKDDPIFEFDGGRISSETVNEYLKPFDITAKDIRGLHANKETQKALKAIRAKGGKLPEDKKEREKKLKEEFKKAVEEAAEIVGHEPTTLKNLYLVPNLYEAFIEDGTVKENLAKQKTASVAAVDLEEQLKLLSPSDRHRYDERLKEDQEFRTNQAVIFLDRRVPKDQVVRLEKERYQKIYRLLKESYKKALRDGKDVWVRGVPQLLPLFYKYAVEALSAEFPGLSFSKPVGFLMKDHQKPLRLWDEAEYIHDYVEKNLGKIHRATKTHGEREDEEVAELVKPLPKKNPPRNDLRKERMEENDGDVGNQGADEDKDMSLNYKRVANRWIEGTQKKLSPDQETLLRSLWYNGDDAALATFLDWPRSKVKRIVDQLQKLGLVIVDSDGIIQENTKTNRIANRWFHSKKDLINVRRKEDGKVVQVTEETLKESPDEYETLEEGEPEPEPKPEPKPEPEKKVWESDMGLVKDDQGKVTGVDKGGNAFKETAKEYGKDTVELVLFLRAFAQGAKIKIPPALAKTKAWKEISDYPVETNPALVKGLLEAKDSPYKEVLDAFDAATSKGKPSIIPEKKKEVEAPTVQEGESKPVPKPEPVPAVEEPDTSEKDLDAVVGMLEVDPDMQDASAKITKRLSDPKTREEAVRAYRETFDEVMNELKNQGGEGFDVSESMATDLGDALKNPAGGRDGKDLGRDLALHSIAKRLADPANLDGVGLSEEPLDEMTLIDRGDRALEFYVKFPANFRQEVARQMVDRIREAKEKGGPQIQELERITAGLQAAAIVHDDFKDKRNKWPLSISRPAPVFNGIVKSLYEKGDTRVVASFGIGAQGLATPEGREKLRQALDSLDEDELFEALGGEKGEWGLMIRNLKKGGLREKDKAWYLNFMKEMTVGEVTTGNTVVMQAATNAQEVKAKADKERERNREVKPTSAQMEPSWSDLIDPKSENTIGEAADAVHKDAQGRLRKLLEALSKCFFAKDEAKGFRDCWNSYSHGVGIARGSTGKLAFSSEENDAPKEEEILGFFQLQQAGAYLESAERKFGPLPVNNPLKVQIQTAIRLDDPSELDKRYVQKK